MTDFRPPVGNNPIISLKIGDDSGDPENEPINLVATDMEWHSFLNGGYYVRIEVLDVGFDVLKRLTQGNGDIKYLKEGRKKPLPMRFKVAWALTDLETEERTAYLTSVSGTGDGQHSRLVFEGIDPPSFLLSAGNADGRVYKGKVSDVIKDVIDDFTGGKIEVDITDTVDSEENIWPTYRMDPKTWIAWLLQWSTSLTKDKGRWIVASKDEKISIKQESELRGKDFGIYDVFTNSAKPKDVLSWSLEMNSSISLSQTKLITGSVSAVSGAVSLLSVDDENTGGKINSLRPGEGEDRGFTKPGAEGWPQGPPATFVPTLPEHSGGEVGPKYSDYADGMARQTFIDLLSSAMRIKIDILGDHRYSDSSILGPSVCTLNWVDTQGEQYFLSGKWLIYAFEHDVSTKDWTTSVYLYRIDHDAEAKEPSVF